MRFDHAGLLEFSTRRVWRAGCCGLLLGLAFMVQSALAAPEATPEPASTATPVAVPATERAVSATLPHTLPSTLRITQARAATPGVAVYLDIRAENGETVADVRAEQLQAEIGPYPASVQSLQAFAAAGEGVAYIFLVDVSKSLKPEQFAKIRDALRQWIEKMGSLDRAAIVTFGETVRTVQDFSADQAALTTKINELTLTDRHTRLHEGLIRALDLGRRDDADLPRRRVIVTLSDGLADAAGGNTPEETLARIKEEPLPIFAIGFAAATVSAKDKEAGFKALGAFAHASGGVFIAADALPLAEVFAQLHKRVGEAYLLRLDCATCPGDGRAYPLRVKLQADKRVLTASSDLRLAAGVVPPPVASPPTVLPPAVLPPAVLPPALAEPAPPQPEPVANLPLWVWLAGAAGIVLLAWLGVLAFLGVRRKEALPAQQAAAPEASPEVRSLKAIELPADLPVTALPEHRPGIAIRLTAVSGTQRGREWLAQVGTQTVIGRWPQCAVVIDDDSEISSRNSVLSAEGCLLFVDDLGSTNGTSLNGSPISGRRRIVDGDLILVGRTELRLTLIKSA